MKIDGKNNISMTRGDSEAILVSCAQNPFREGDTITFTVRKTALSPKVIEKKVTEFTEDGKGLIKIHPEETEKMSFGSYLYDIQWTRADGEVKTIIRPAAFMVEKEVSYDG